MTRRAGMLLRRAGRVGVALGLTALGLAAGLLCSGAAGAVPADSIQVKMAGDTGFSGVATHPLLDVGGLAPGGTVSGVMVVRDNSGTTAGSGIDDSLHLTMINVRAAGACPSGRRPCAGAGTALAGALRFDLQVTDGATGSVLRRSAETVDSLQRGVMLGSGLAQGDELGVRLTASLPAEVGNEIAYGSLGFDLQVSLISVAGESAQAGGGGTTGSDGSSGGSGGTTLGGGSGSSGGGSGGTPGGTLVIGAGGGDLASTGAPVWWLLGAAGALLVAGLALAIPGGRRRKATTERWRP